MSYASDPKVVVGQRARSTYCRAACISEDLNACAGSDRRHQRICTECKAQMDRNPHMKIPILPGCWYVLKNDVTIPRKWPCTVFKLGIPGGNFRLVVLNAKATEDVRQSLRSSAMVCPTPLRDLVFHVEYTSRNINMRLTKESRDLLVTHLKHIHLSRPSPTPTSSPISPSSASVASVSTPLSITSLSITSPHSPSSVVDEQKDFLFSDKDVGYWVQPIMVSQVCEILVFPPPAHMSRLVGVVLRPQNDRIGIMGDKMVQVTKRSDNCFVFIFEERFALHGPVVYDVFVVLDKSDSLPLQTYCIVEWLGSKQYGSQSIMGYVANDPSSGQQGGQTGDTSTNNNNTNNSTNSSNNNSNDKMDVGNTEYLFWFATLLLNNAEMGIDEDFDKHDEEDEAKVESAAIEAIELVQKLEDIATKLKASGVANLNSQYSQQIHTSLDDITKLLKNIQKGYEGYSNETRSKMIEPVEFWTTNKYEQHVEMKDFVAAFARYINAPEGPEITLAFSVSRVDKMNLIGFQQFVEHFGPTVQDLFDKTKVVLDSKNKVYEWFQPLWSHERIVQEIKGKPFILRYGNTEKKAFSLNVPDGDSVKRYQFFNGSQGYYKSDAPQKLYKDVVDILRNGYQLTV